MSPSPNFARKAGFPGNVKAGEVQKALRSAGLEELPHVLFETEIPRFRQQAPDPDTLLIVDLMLYSGPRISEACGLKFGDINLDEGWARIRAENAKRSKERRVPVEPHLRGYIAATMRSRGAGPDDFLFTRSDDLAERSAERNLYNYVKKMYSDAGLVREEFTVHDLRHTAITRMLERGIPIEKVQLIAGHESIEMTLVYTHLSTKQLIRSFEEAFPI